jgi:RNA polymerase sigma-70 factor (ECF subfamily)
VDLSAPAGVPSLEDELATRQALLALDRALPTLPELERMAVLMIDVEHLEREEACRLLAITPNHLRVVLHRGRNRLRKVLEHVV